MHCSLTLLKTPLQAAQKNRLNMLTELMNRFAKINRHEVLEWLKILFYNYSRRDKAVIFYDLANTATFHKTLQIIISGNDLETGISLSPLSRKGSSSADAQIKAWLDAVNIDRVNVAVKPCISRQTGPDRIGKLSIYLKSEQDNGGDRAQDNNEAIQESNISGKEWVNTRSGALAGAAYRARIVLCNPNSEFSVRLMGARTLQRKKCFYSDCLLVIEICGKTVSDEEKFGIDWLTKVAIFLI